MKFSGSSVRDGSVHNNVAEIKLRNTTKKHIFSVLYHPRQPRIVMGAEGNFAVSTGESNVIPKEIFGF